jgi:hypothetical protein
VGNLKIRSVGVAVKLWILWNLCPQAPPGEYYIRIDSEVSIFFFLREKEQHYIENITEMTPRNTKIQNRPPAR